MNHTLSNTEPNQARQHLDNLLEALNKIILGNPSAVELAVSCLLAQGHLLIEDLPGVGKTTLSRALASLLGLPYKRVQFTNDLLPSDVLGVTIYDMDSKKFRFKKGPVFTSVLLADEINRANPKTQSALLQAMEEQQVSVDGTEFDLPAPFFVIATQNPQEQSGTFPLPESQLDRFLMRISIGYPDREHELQLLQQNKRGHSLAIDSLLSASELQLMMQAVSNVHASDAVIEYLQNIIQKTRDSGRFINGLSPRAGLQWLQAAKAYAFVQGRDMVLPEDVRDLFPHTASHRLHSQDGSSTDEIMTDLLETIEII